jgi:hypothetical protein
MIDPCFESEKSLFPTAARGDLLSALGDKISVAIIPSVA